jgi:hypothetical protein
MIMGKKKKHKKRRKTSARMENNLPAGTINWQDAEGVHVVAPGMPPSAEEVAKMTEEYQNQIRNSPLWKDMVRQFGLKKAEELLKQCQVEIKPG